MSRQSTEALIRSAQDGTIWLSQVKFGEGSSTARNAQGEEVASAELADVYDPHVGYSGSYNRALGSFNSVSGDAPPQILKDYLDDHFGRFGVGLERAGMRTAGDATHYAVALGAGEVFGSVAMAAWVARTALVARGAATVYRGLAAGENAAAGLVARAPEAGNSIVSHVAGQWASQWISSTKSLEVATSRFGQNGVVAIDLSKVGGHSCRSVERDPWARTELHAIALGNQDAGSPHPG